MPGTLTNALHNNPIRLVTLLSSFSDEKTEKEVEYVAQRRLCHESTAEEGLLLLTTFL